MRWKWEFENYDVINFVSVGMIVLCCSHNIYHYETGHKIYINDQICNGKGRFKSLLMCEIIWHTKFVLKCNNSLWRWGEYGDVES